MTTFEHDMEYKKFRNHRFHTTLLIPKAVVETAFAEETPEARLESILLWIDTYQSAHYFKEGQTVYHKENLNQPMIVDRVIRKVWKTGGQQKVKVLGIDVHWWEEVPDHEFV